MDNGKTQFANLCASCHTLAASGTPPSNIGPNLDDSFRASRQAGIEDSQFSGVVQRWITEAQKPMPRDLVTGQDAVDVAAYIAAGRGDGRGGGRERDLQGGDDARGAGPVAAGTRPAGVGRSGSTASAR